MLTLPAAPGPLAAPGRYVRLTLARGPGPDFSERDRISRRMPLCFFQNFWVENIGWTLAFVECDKIITGHCRH